MATKAKAAPAEAPQPDALPATCNTLEDRLAHIQALGKRIEEHIQFVLGVATLSGTSAESKQKAVTAFHDRLAHFERALVQTLDELRLG
jgi:hypothetical protein